ncbi:MAG: hypothetical protein DRP67_06330 [Candidatus Omnitrophota bacterium]|nr:MAG: hypothetical protein DRP67_06330 [Candidatus Omnitrophota bacterium]
MLMLKLFQRNKIIFYFCLITSLSQAKTITLCLGEYKNYPYQKIKNYKTLYPGKITVKKYKGKYLILNRMDMEKYLCGVLSKEMDSNWPFEALKAQAVVSRTYLLWKGEENRKNGLPYDIKNSIYHQSYGICKSQKIANAVNETKGEILIFNGKVAKVFFHACCGGKTTLPVFVWGGNYSGIDAVNDPYCEDSPYSNWEKKFSSDYLSKIFGMDNIKDIEIIKRDPSGRVEWLKLKDEKGKTLKLTGYKMRLVINEKTGKVNFKNPKILPSTLFNVKKEGIYFIFKGRGYGHGIGLCQWGARRMAEKGKNYKEILHFFFPEMTILEKEER